MALCHVAIVRETVGRAMRIVVAGALGILLAAGVAQARCAWTGGGSEAVGRFLHEWVEQRGGTLARWDVGISDDVARIELRTGGGTVRIAVTLGSDCAQPPTAVVDTARQDGGFPTTADIDALAAGFPADRQGGPGPAPPPSKTGPLAVPFTLIAILAVTVAAATPQRRATRAVTCALVLALIGIAAWPLLFQSIGTDAPVQRAAAAASDVFGDMFHPFLPFALSRPITWWSIEPWALRLVPLAFLGIETVLLMFAAARDGGNVAAALAGIWFACEVRRRHGIWDVSDWDVAGTFLMAMLLTLPQPWARGWRGALFLALLMSAGVASSWLMTVPAGVLLGSVGIEVMRRRWPILPALLLGVVFAGLAILTMQTFSTGSQVGAEIDAATLWSDMYQELPVGREVVMAIPLALGIGWLLLHLDRVAPRFVAVCLVVVPVAVIIAHAKSHVAGGYYIGLATPLLLYASAVAIVQTAAGLASLPGGANVAARIAAAVALVSMTVVRSAPGGAPPIVEYLTRLAHETRADDWPIYTNRADVLRLLAYERARTGEGPLTMDTAMFGPADLRSRLITPGVCPPPQPVGERGFYVALAHPDAEQRRCLDELMPRCRDLGPGPYAGDWIVLRCPR